MSTELEMIPIQDIPDNLNEELERLHRLLQSESDLINWARLKIDTIHNQLLNPQFKVNSK